ncbi:glycosyltransferase [Thermogladius sp. 4427co]|uniref:glycosyltransferase n=1 Tax=Thermogladius sp. 4427co TaxID=3450718 RepID=UPI003F796D4C
MLLDFIGLSLALAHFTVPLAYYAYIVKYYRRPWDIGLEPGYKPRVTVIVPTYNEARLIERRLDNIYSQDYPRDLLEVIVVDSASTDGTVEKVAEWCRRHPDIAVRIVREGERRGKGFALNNALKYCSGEIIVVTDADSEWVGRDCLSKAVSWFSNPTVGAVSCVKTPASSGLAGVEEGYRGFYNIMRVGESKAWSTPVFHGELAAYRRSLLEEIGGFPTDIGADDSYTATRIALMGYRAIIPGDIACLELVPSRGYHKWRIRRAQHLVQHFWKILRARHKAPKRFKTVLYAETYLHLFNPWILLAAAILLAASAATGSLLAILLLTLGLALLLFKPYRTWIATQLYLIAAAVRNLWTRELAWEKTLK